MPEAATTIQLIGAGAFGALIGWYVYYVNRHRKSDVQIGDVTTILGVVGGGAVTALFPGKTDLFGAYGIGLAIGFFSYFIVLLYLVAQSKSFDSDWFLDGRRKDADGTMIIPGDGGGRPLEEPPPRSATVEHYWRDGSRGVVAGPTVVGEAQAGAWPEANPKAQEIINQCEAVWEANKADCNAFAKAVASKFGVTLTGQANDIADQIKGAGWEQLGKDGVKAAQAAAAGKLVVAALKGSDMNPKQAHGHVAIVVEGPLAHAKYPSGYWGQLGGVGEKNKTLNYAWRTNDRDNVHYGAKVV